MDVINKWMPGLFILLVLTAPGKCLAQQKAAAATNQRPQFYFDKPITLDSLTRFVHSHSAIRFSFNSSKVKGDKIINLKKGAYTIGLLLQEIRKNTSLYYTMFNGYVIFQDNPPKQKTPAPAVKKNYAKPPVHKTNHLSHQKGVAKPVPPPPPADTTKIITLINPDSLNRVVVVDSSRHTDTVYHKVKDTIGLFLGFAVAEMERDVRIRNGHDNTIENNNWHLKQGKPLTGPVYIDSLKDRRWVKDTMPGKTKTIRVPVSRKEERAIARSSRHSGYANYGQHSSNWNWQFGLHWKVTIPLKGDGHYSTAPNNSSQPFNPLIPGIWLSRHNEQHEILLLVKPAEWTIYNNNVIKTDSSTRKYGNDSLPVNVRLRHTTSFLKSGGIYAGLQYNYHISENFVMGAGIGYQTLGQTLGLKQTKRKIDTGSFGASFPDTLFTVKGDSLTNRYMRSSLILAKFEAAYKLGMLDLGAAVVFPLTSAFTSQSKDQQRPLSVQVFVRWRLKREEETF
jgi:hypothetical protein